MPEEVSTEESRSLRGRKWFVFVVIGVLGGVLSGLFAIGGGILIVPLLVWWGGLDQRTAAATSLVAIVPTAIVASLTYLIHGKVDLIAAGCITPGAVVGAVIGAALLRRIPLVWLRWMFITFIVLIAIRLLFMSPVRGHSAPLSVITALAYVALGLVMGVSSGLFGIGGGIIAVPLLIEFFAMSDLVAKGTSLLVTVPTSIVGSVTNHRTGLVNVRTGLIVGVPAALASIPAVALALVIPPRLSGILFAVLLLLVAAQLAVRAIRASPQARRGERPSTPKMVKSNDSFGELPMEGGSPSSNA